MGTPNKNPSVYLWQHQETFGSQTRLSEGHRDKRTAVSGALFVTTAAEAPPVTADVPTGGGGREGSGGRGT